MPSYLGYEHTNENNDSFKLPTVTTYTRCHQSIKPENQFFQLWVSLFCIQTVTSFSTFPLSGGPDLKCRLKAAGFPDSLKTLAYFPCRTLQDFSSATLEERMIGRKTDRGVKKKKQWSPLRQSESNLRCRDRSVAAVQDRRWKLSALTVLRSASISLHS